MNKMKKKLCSCQFLICYSIFFFWLIIITCLVNLITSIGCLVLFFFIAFLLQVD